MFPRIKYIFLFFSFSFLSPCIAQLPQEEEMMVRISKEIWVGATIHTNGFGLNYNVAKFKTYKKKSLINFEVLGVKHEKEYKIFGSFDENAKKYVFGKLNSLHIIRFGMGRRKVIFEKIRENGIQICFNWTLGPSLGCVKPVYLEVFKLDVFGQPIGVSTERYDPTEHNIYNIYGRGPWIAGFSEMKFNIGAYSKFGLEFDYSSAREIINLLEIGIALDYFPKPIEIMTQVGGQNIFPIIYLNCSIGNKLY